MKFQKCLPLCILYLWKSFSINLFSITIFFSPKNSPCFWIQFSYLLTFWKRQCCLFSNLCSQEYQCSEGSVSKRRNGTKFRETECCRTVCHISLTTHFQLRDIQSPAYNELQYYTPYHVNRLNEETASNLNFGKDFRIM